ncbi:AAA family ATPase [Clostridium sporogenes]|uniref:AAA family ATPase n=1 Tax=Clostridium sporogenes TaxID=1509 RepID=UPI002237ECD6|nr:AAA family ATPase [Clostridium sporogenes]MCW6060870.1 AAA family ATPase [Clostridium sporogenes]MCW6068609.1 AAA family ATPase [Clostridium sporogenes]
MKLAKMNIKNYRQFEDETIFYDDNLTILAGANNSGKTSLVELYKNIFIKKDKNFSIEDMPIRKVYQDANKLLDIIVKVYKDTINKEEFFNELNDIFLKGTSGESDKNLQLIQGIVVDIEVSYGDEEKISRFSDYLMELECQNRSFYFRYALELNGKKLYNTFRGNFSKLENRIKDYLNSEKEKEEDKKIILRDFILKQCNLCFQENYYYCNSTYTITLPMKLAEFKDLFNCNYISATRELNDQKEDENYSISKEMLSILKLDENWEAVIEGMPENITQLINDADVKKSIESSSIKGLKNTIRDISETTDGNVGEMSLSINIDDDDLMLFLTRAIETRYEHNDIYLKEASQGLGFSNWIYIYLKLEKFCKAVKKEIVNFFIIEEPEAHMHPHMQRALIKHLNSSYCEKEIQGIITTHSNELVRASELEKIRVIRQTEPFINKIYDMDYFKTYVLSNEEERNFFNLLFSINYSDLIFSNKIIMYEGDTEKLFIEALLKNDVFPELANQYISYVQVGGAYAHKYKKLINYLRIKTLIITDVDYCKTITSKNNILEAETENGCIKSFYKDDICTKDIQKKKVTIDDIYNWIQLEDGQVHVQFQRPEDNYARTLEEAMLCKYLKMSLSDYKTRTEWNQIKKEKKLKFSIPAKSEEEKKDGATEKSFNIRDIVQATGGSKADFMYSVILNKKEVDMLPFYIKEGLGWLQK